MDGRKFPLVLKGAVYKSYVRPAILHGSEAWKKQVEEESVNVSFEKGRCSLPIKVECWCKIDCCGVESGESGRSHLLGILPDFKHWCLSL